MAGPATTGAGAKPVTTRRVLAIALPIVLSNATVPLLGLDVLDAGGLAEPERQLQVLLGQTAGVDEHVVQEVIRR